MNLAEIPYIIYAEETPNPSSVKFVANKLLLVSGATAEYQNITEATFAPIVKQLFQFPFVKSIFIASNFITITKHDAVIWEEIRDELRVFITNYLNKGNAIIEKLPEKLVAKDSNFKETISVNTQHVAPTNDIENKIIARFKIYDNIVCLNDGLLYQRSISNKKKIINIKNKSYDTILYSLLLHNDWSTNR